MNKSEDICKDVPSLKNLNTNDIAQSLLIDAGQVMCDAMRNYLTVLSNDAKDKFVQEIRGIWDQFARFNNNIYLYQNPAIRDIDHKNRLLLKYLIRDNITKQAFQEYLENVHPF